MDKCLSKLRRQLATDFKSASAGGLTGLNDTNVLAIAATEGRVLVSHDKRTMPTHFVEFIQNNPSSGVIIASQSLPIAVVVEELLLI